MRSLEWGRTLEKQRGTKRKKQYPSENNAAIPRQANNLPSFCLLTPWQGEKSLIFLWGDGGGGKKPSERNSLQSRESSKNAAAGRLAACEPICETKNEGGMPTQTDKGGKKILKVNLSEVTPSPTKTHRQDRTNSGTSASQGGIPSQKGKI